MLKICFLLFSFLLSSSLASANPIDLNCKDKRTFGYRYDSPLPPKWGDETFNTTWSIRYDGVSDRALIDNKPVMALKGNGTVILIEYSANQNSQSLWSYAIHLAEGRVTASQVNVYDMMGAGLKSRSVEMDCN